MTEHDKLVEDCARDLFELRASSTETWGELGIWWKDQYRKEARAALAIAVERCAAEVLAQKNSGFVWRDVEYGWDVACDSAAAAIRALLSPNDREPT